MERDLLIAQMFSRIARWYDFLNHFLSLGMDIYWRKKMVECIEDPPEVVLDIATGTMDVARLIQRRFPTATLLGCDLSREMLKHGKTKVPPLLATVANAKYLPVKEESIDVVTIAFGVRNIIPRPQLYKEVYRVLKNRGSFIILEFASARERIWFGIYNLYLERLLPLLGRLISRDKEAYSYLARTIKEFPRPEKLREELLESGFSTAAYFPLSKGIVNIHLAKKISVTP